MGGVARIPLIFKGEDFGFTFSFSNPRCQALRCVSMWEKLPELPGDVSGYTALAGGVEGPEKRPFSYTLNPYIWVFPKIMGKPPNHPLKNRVFHEINHPFWG